MIHCINQKNPTTHQLKIHKTKDQLTEVAALL